MTGMTKGEREELQRLIRQREKVLKSAARQRSAELSADFENQMGQQYSFDQDGVWLDATDIANREIEKAQARIAERCAQLGIPKRFAPELRIEWYSRGENAVKERRNELRKMANSRIEAIEQEAIVKVELASINAQTEIATQGLTSKAARDFIEKLPSVESLMPTLAITDMADEAEPPIAEQLVSPNALRQRRHRERQRALRDASETLQAPLRNAPQTLQSPTKPKPKIESTPAATDDDLDISECLRRTPATKQGVTR
jgi:hypothetical protein